MEFKLYQSLEMPEFETLLKKEGLTLKDCEEKELNDDEHQLHGTFYFIQGYGLKLTYSIYLQCLITPTETHTRQHIAIPKAIGDRGRSYYARKSGKYGKEGFNPTTGTGSPSGKKTL